MVDDLHTNLLFKKINFLFWNNLRFTEELQIAELLYISHSVSVSHNVSSYVTMVLCQNWESAL